MKSVIFTVVLALTMQFASAQNLINGVVTSKDNEPLSGATIKLTPGDYETITNGGGRFVINNVKNGNYKLQVTYLGHEPYREKINVNGKTTLKISMEESVIQTREIIVSSTRATEKTPTSHTTIGGETIEKREAVQDIPYLLKLTPSVVTTSDAGAGVGYTNFRIRGTDLNRINITVNDIPLNDAESHGVWFVNMPDFIESTNSIQVQRGVGTSTNGAAAFGASINLQTNDISIKPYAELNNAVGSFNTMKNTVKAGTGLMEGKYSFDARLSRIKSDGFIDRASSDLKSFFVSGTYRSEKDVVRVNVFSGKEKTYQSWEGIPGAKLEEDSAAMMQFAYNMGYAQEEIENLFESDPRTYNRYMYQNQIDNYQQDHYQVFYTRNFSEKLSANVAYHQTNGFGYYESYRYNEDIEDYLAAPIIAGPDTITETDVIDRKYLDNIFYGGIGSVKLNLPKIKAIIGGGWNRYDGDHYGEVFWAENNLNTFEPRHRFYDNTGIKDDANIYARANLMINEQLYTYIDLQYRHINYDIDGLDDGQRDITQSHTYDFFNPKAGLLFEPSEKISTYLNVAIANREPNRTTLVDADPAKAEPTSEKLYNAELGADMQQKTWRVKANAYLMYYKDQLVLTGNINDVGSAIMENVDNSYRAGIEVIWTIKPTDWFQWAANLTYSKNKILDFVSYTDNWDTWGQEIEDLGTTNISFSPEIIANSELSFSPTRNLGISLITQYVGEQYIDNTSNEDRKLDEYLVNNLRINYTIETTWLKKASVYAQVNNLFDEAYISNAWIYPFYAGGEINYLDGYYPQAGINFMAGINLKF